jgi:hypothetical protein
MQTLEFTQALEHIVEELKAEELLSLLEPWLNPANQPIAEPSKDQFSSLIFSSNAGYQQLLRQAATRKILEQFHVAEFFEPSRLRTMLFVISSISHTQQIYSQGPTFAQFYSFAELLRSFRRMESACKRLLEEEKIGQIPDSDGILELELIEYSDEAGISPKRLAIFIASITELHTNLTMIYGIQGDKLTFKYFDSGSGLLVGIQGTKAIIEAMGTLLNQWWDKIRFWRYDTFEKKMGAISKGLTIVDTVQQAVEKGTITRETGENLKLRVFRQVDNLIGIGATIPLGEEATIDQKQLLTEIRNTKLLSTGSPIEPDGEKGISSNH